MSDLIFKNKGKETFRIPFPTPGTKCPETQLEIKMTEIEKTEAEIKVLQAKLDLLKEIETYKSQPRMELVDGGKIEIVSYNEMVYYRLEFPDVFYWYENKYSDDGLLMGAITDGETCNLLEGLWFNEVKGGKYD